MKGLLLKDLELIKSQKQFALVIVVVVAFMFFNDGNTTFAIAYANMVCLMLGITTLNYDAFENGYAFLFTLPITRKMYVKEKYVFSLLCLSAGVVLSLIVLCVTGLNEENISFLCGYICIAMICLALLLPVEMKFGPEKSRMALLAIVVFGIAIVALLSKTGIINMNEEMIALASVSIFKIILVLVVVSVIILWISFQISCRIMERKEF